MRKLMRVVGADQTKTFVRKDIRIMVLCAMNVLVITACGSSALAGLTWDPTGSTTGGSDGAGNWSDANVWYNGTTTSSWVDNSDAVLGSGGTGGTVTLAGIQTVNTITFNNSGYGLSGGTLKLGLNAGTNNFSGGAALTVANGVTAEVDSALQGSNTYLLVGTTSAGAASSLTLKGGTSLNLNSLGLGGYGSVTIAGGSYVIGGAFQSTATSVTQGAASITAGNMIMGPAAPSSPGTTSYTMNDAAAALTLTGGDLQIGRNGRVATFDLKQGKLAVAGSIALISSDYSSTGTLKVEGGTASATGSLVLNNSGGGSNNSKVATALISGGTLSVAGVRFGGNSNPNFVAGSAGILTVTGGSLYIGNGGITEAIYHPVTETITLSGGTVGASADWSSSMAMTLATTNGNITLRAADSAGAAHQISLGGVLSGAGGMTKTGAGVLQLSGHNTYAGDTTVTEGTLLLATADTLAGATGTLRVQGGTVSTAGGAAVGGDVNLSSGQISIADAGGVGTLTLGAGKNLTMSGGTLSITISDGTSFDSIAGSGVVTITGGTLDLLNGAGIQYGDTYQLLTGFSSVAVSGLSIINYDTEHYVASLGSDGVLSFAPASVPEAASLGLLTFGALGLLLRRR